MTPSLEKQINYWDETWIERCAHDNPMVVSMNKRKLDFIIKNLFTRPYYVKMKKLDIGCGTCIHHSLIASLIPTWAETTLGIDMAKSAIEKAHVFGLAAVCADIFDYDFTIKFDAFFFMDSLEHIPDHERLADRVLEIAESPFMVFGNIPLYASTPHKDGGFEKPMGRKELSAFMRRLGMREYWQHIYGCFGFPYMLFEAYTLGRAKDWNEEDIISLS